MTMDYSAPTLLRRLLFMLIASLLVFVGLPGAAIAPQPSVAKAHAAAMTRWAETGFANYTATFALEVRGKSCYQQVDVRNGLVAQVRQDTCELSWPGMLTISEFFDVIDQVTNLPDSRCEPAAQQCACHRVFQERRAEYNPAYGFPELLYSQSSVAFNWRSAAFWDVVLDTHQLPRCTAAERTLVVKTLWVIPQQ